MNILNKIIIIIVSLLAVGCSDCILMQEGNYCMENDDCDTGQTCVHGECSNYVTSEQEI